MYWEVPGLFGRLHPRALNPQGMTGVSCKEAGLGPIGRAPTKRTMGGALGAEPWNQDCGWLKCPSGGNLGHIKATGIKDHEREFPGCPVVRNPPSNVGNVGSIPGRGSKVPHASEQLKPPMTTRESQQAANKDPEQSKDLRKWP